MGPQVGNPFCVALTAAVMVTDMVAVVSGTPKLRTELLPQLVVDDGRPGSNWMRKETTLPLPTITFDGAAAAEFTPPFE
jgi:hypothetical protein